MYYVQHVLPTPSRYLDTTHIHCTQTEPDFMYVDTAEIFYFDSFRFGYHSVFPL